MCHTKTGIGCSLRLESERRFVSLGTSLPIRKDFEDHLDLVSTLNSDVFLGCFVIDDDKDLLVSCSMSYAWGLILAQLSRFVRRFDGLLDHVVSHYDKGDEMFAFGNQGAATSEAPSTSLQ